jgi:hypothetical protein
MKAAPGDRGARPLSEPRRGVRLVAGGSAPGNGALSPPAPLPASGERGGEGGVRGLVRGFHPRLFRLLPCGERPTARLFDLLLWNDWLAWTRSTDLVSVGYGGF